MRLNHTLLQTMSNTCLCLEYLWVAGMCCDLSTGLGLESCWTLSGRAPRHALVTLTTLGGVHVNK